MTSATARGTTIVDLTTTGSATSTTAIGTVTADSLLLPREVSTVDAHAMTSGTASAIVREIGTGIGIGTIGATVGAMMIGGTMTGMRGGIGGMRSITGGRDVEGGFSLGRHARSLKWTALCDCMSRWLLEDDTRVL